MNKLKITYKKTSDLKPYENNARTHSDEQVAQLVESMRQYGFTNPILIDGDNGIIAGHGRWMAAQQLEIAQVPTTALAHLTDEQKRAYIIADNKLAENSGWDESLLAIELGGLRDAGFDLGLTGFSDAEASALIASLSGGGNTDPDHVPELPADPVTVLGDVWVMGDHRLMCGDSTSKDVDLLLANHVPHLMVTDPPYGVSYDANWRNEAEGVGGFGDKAKAKAKAGVTTSRAVGQVLNDDNADWTEAYNRFPGEVCYVWHPPGATQFVFFESITRAGFEIRMQIIWAKSRFPIGRGHYHVQHEPCYYAVKKKSGATGHWQGGRKETTLWEISHSKNETGHSTQKPIECMRRPILNNSMAGDYIYEPFSGSGTTLIAGEMEGRNVLAMELNAPYVDVSVNRWQDFSGKTATLESTGQTFAEVAAERE